MFENLKEYKVGGHAGACGTASDKLLPWNITKKEK